MVDARASRTARLGLRGAAHGPGTSRNASGLPDDFDPWAPDVYSDLPKELVSAFETKDWPRVRDQLRTVMDGVTTDGPYGRQLIQLVRHLPLRVDPLFDRYRAITAIDYGDWDDLQACLLARPLERVELEGIRDIWLAPVGQTTIPRATAAHQAALFEVHEVELQRDWSRYRRWARKMLRSRYADIYWSREDIPTARHLLYRGLQDVVLLSIAEANGGRLPTAAALAREGQRLGGDREPLRIVAHDVEILSQAAMGQGLAVSMRWPSRVASSIGFSPLGTWEILAHLLPMMTLLADDAFKWSVAVSERIAVRLASPRAQLQAETWRVACDLLINREPSRSEL